MSKFVLPMIIEYPDIKGEELGFYIDKTDAIFVRDVTDKFVLIHECVHFLWDRKDSQLRDVLKVQDLDYNSTVEEVLNNEIIHQIYSDGGLEGYEPESYLNEAIAYIICCSTDDKIRELNIELLNHILDNNFFYHDKEGNVYHTDLDVPITVNDDIKEFILILRECDVL